MDAKHFIRKTIYILPLIFLLIFPQKLNAGSKNSNKQSSWYDATRNYRVLIEVQSGSNSYYNKPVLESINFTTLLAGNSDSGSLADESLLMVEVDIADNVIDSDISFQFDKADNYEAATNASGILTFILKGTTSTSSTRYFDLYYDITGKSYGKIGLKSLLV